MTAAYLKLSAETLKDIKGPVRDRDSNKDGSIALIAVDHGVVSPRDAATGQATGRRQHLPITVTKATDQTSPFFWHLVARNEPITTAAFFFFGSQPGLSGRETLLYRLTITRAFVSKVEFVGRTDPAATEENNRFVSVEKISLVYDSIKWDWFSPQASAEDVFNSKATA